MYSGTSEESDLIIADGYEKYVPNIISRYEYMRQKRKMLSILENQHFKPVHVLFGGFGSEWTIKRTGFYNIR